MNFSFESILCPEKEFEALNTLIKDNHLESSNIILEVMSPDIDIPKDHLKQIVGYLKDKGYRISLDKMDALEATLEVFEIVQPDYVKLDMNLVRNIQIDSYNQQKVKRVIDIANASQCQVIALGLETEKEKDWVENAGVDLVQGFFFFEPTFFEI